MSLTGIALATAPMALLIMATSYVTSRWPRGARFLEGTPLVVVRDGVPIDDVLRHERIPVDELLQAARGHGLGDLEADWCILEPDGTTSRGDTVEWTFYPPPGDTLRVSLDATIEPGVQWRRQATTTVSTGGAAAEVAYTTWVMP